MTCGWPPPGGCHEEPRGPSRAAGPPAGGLPRGSSRAPSAGWRATRGTVRSMRRSSCKAIRALPVHAANEPARTAARVMPRNSIRSMLPPMWRGRPRSDLHAALRVLRRWGRRGVPLRSHGVGGRGGGLRAPHLVPGRACRPEGEVRRAADRERADDRARVVADGGGGCGRLAGHSDRRSGVRRRGLARRSGSGARASGAGRGNPAGRARGHPCGRDVSRRGVGGLDLAARPSLRGRAPRLVRDGGGGRCGAAGGGEPPGGGPRSWLRRGPIPCGACGGLPWGCWWSGAWAPPRS